MNLIREGDKGYAYGGKFTGPVELEMMSEGSSAGAPDVARVHFHDGAITNWHSHPAGQLLYLVSGVGRVGSASGNHFDLPVGTLVVTPADEAHWHGAEEGSACVWLATTWGVTEWTDLSPALGGSNGS